MPGGGAAGIAAAARRRCGRPPLWIAALSRPVPGMSAGRKEKRFLDALESLFTGAEVDGDSGFVNLMRIKRKYFQSIRPQLMAEIDKRAEKDTSFREELFDKLYTFFSRYFCESGSIYFRHLPAFSRIYERVYADGRDVALSWKTRMLYYVKSDVLVRSMPVELNEEGKPQNTRRFYFDASAVEHKKNNERREFVFTFAKVGREPEGRVVHIGVAYSSGGVKTKADEIVKQARKGGVPLTADELHKAIGVFRRQTEADFFINKDAKGFLREQFDLWAYQYIFHGDTVFEEKRIRQIQALRDTAYDIIDFIAQFEDELRRAWEKPKFVRGVHYVVTLDRLTDAVLKKITRHKGAKPQIKEWRELGMVDEAFSMKAVFGGQKRMKGNGANGVSGDYQFLPLDTRHFKDLELEILDGLGNLDEALDGELVHSENWQALNSLRKRYAGKVKCVYIDPPYNSKTSEIAYKNTYKHSSWISLMDNRLELSAHLSTTDGSHVVAIDENEQEVLGQLLSIHFPDHEKVCVAIVHNKKGIQGDYFSYNHEYAYFYMPKSLCGTNGKPIPKSQWEYVNLRKWGRESERRTAKNCFYPIYVENGEVVGFGDGCDDKFSPEQAHVPYGKGGKKIAVYPVDSQGIERKWRYARSSVENVKYLLKVHITRSEEIQIHKAQSESQVKTVWDDSIYIAGDYGTRWLTDLSLKFTDDLYPKSIHTVADSIRVVSGRDAVICDYFAGSGTTAHAVINLNREDGGNRKYLLIEIGDYFRTALLPRIKKVVYSGDWKDGKPVSRDGSSHFLKYYILEQYEETLKNSHYQDGQQLELDSAKSPFEQYVFFGDDKLAHAVNPKKGSGKLEIKLKNLYPDIDIAESLSNILGKQIRKRTADTVTFADGTTEKTDPATMTEHDKQHFISLIKPYLWWGE